VLPSAAALLDGIFEHPAHKAPVAQDVLTIERPFCQIWFLPVYQKQQCLGSIWTSEAFSDLHNGQRFRR
jgi:hypothetical protein